MIISLIGLPGSGKSTVGRQLARRLQLDYFDADAVIEARIGCSIRLFFEREGEDRFRDVEEQVIGELTSVPAAILSTGGGAVLRPQNRLWLRSRTQPVYLKASPEDLLRRVRHDRNRPLLQGGDPLGRLRDLYSVRDPLYREVAAFTIETGRPSVATMVNMILMQFELTGLLPLAPALASVAAPPGP